MRLCREIGIPGLNSLDWNTASDACWLHSYVLNTEDDSLIAEVTAGITIQLLVKKLGDYDINVQIPALKACANMVVCEDPPHVVDRALFEQMIPALMKLS